MSLTIEEEEYAIEKILEAIEDPEKFHINSDGVEMLKKALTRHQAQLLELKESQKEKNETP